jgi:hypothetical protein
MAKVQVYPKPWYRHIMRLRHCFHVQLFDHFCQSGIHSLSTTLKGCQNQSQKVATIVSLR